MVVNAGGIISLLNVICCSMEFVSSYAILALGHIADKSPLLASAIIQSKVIKYAHFNLLAFINIELCLNTIRKLTHVQ